ncbi:E3 ubiquitin-protein ligase TRIM39-like [Siphateles boraxobius]|uniref:E3 ubiquitin-protein ligase TRIM39-like n=1 Tax=Siphateles boraxobius TaxID=180520 RepID=UPI004064532D
MFAKLKNKILEEQNKAMAEEAVKQSKAMSIDALLTTLSSSSGPLAEELQCSICLDVFTDPVSTPCGHNFCKSCLNQCWDNSQTYNCPLCKETFNTRPYLKINIALREVVLLFTEISGQSKSEVLCDICDDVKMKALKMCLVCQSSYCQTHLEPHQRVPKLKKHKLIDPVENLEVYICQKHDKPLELFCRDDQTCVCLLCAVTNHRNHNTVSIEEESEERKSQLQTDVKQTIQDKMKRIQDFKSSAKHRKETSEKEKAETIALFTDLIRSIERCQSELLKMMEQKQKAAERKTEEFIKELEQEISELKRRDTELEQLSHTEDHLHLLQIYPSLSGPAHTSSWTDICNSDTHESVTNLRKALIQLQETLEERLNKTVSPELKWIQRYAVDVTLDPDTAHPLLILSDDGKQVTCGDTELKLKDNTKRFDYCYNVLAKEGFSSGRFYFEVQVKGNTEWDLGVARESINRKGMITAAPENGYWTVFLRDGNHYQACEGPDVSLSLRVKPQVVGVFVDYEEGLVSFYDVESRSHIYSFTGQSFTEKLYPFFSPSDNESENAAPLIILHVK